MPVFVLGGNHDDRDTLREYFALDGSTGKVGAPFRYSTAVGPQVRRVVCGHVHRAAFDVLGGCGVVACPSTYLQAPLEIPGDELRLVHEPAAFFLHAEIGNDLISHLQPIQD